MSFWWWSGTPLVRVLEPFCSLGYCRRIYHNSASRGRASLSPRNRLHLLHPPPAIAPPIRLTRSIHVRNTLALSWLSFLIRRGSYVLQRCASLWYMFPNLLMTRQLACSSYSPVLILVSRHCFRNGTIWSSLALAVTGTFAGVHRSIQFSALRSTGLSRVDPLPESVQNGSFLIFSTCHAICGLQEQAANSKPRTTVTDLWRPKQLSR